MDEILRGSTLLFDPRMSALLHLVEYTKSVQEACSFMQISYSTAWHMLNRVEDELVFPLVMHNRGGASGNRTILTEKGKPVMDAYDKFSEQVKEEADLLYRNFFHDPIYSHE